LERDLKRDPEFILHSRYLTAEIRVVLGAAQSFRIVVRAGEVVDVDPIVTPFDSYDIQLAGTEEQWEALLAPTPAPFYQDFYPAMLHHGFRIEGNMEMIMAYYAAIRRLAEIFRAVATAEVAA
jgi:hypothetical protein